MTNPERTMSVQYRAGHPLDTAVVKSLLSRAFGREEEANLATRLRKDGVLLFDFTAWADNQLVGYLALSTLPLHFGQGEKVEAAALAPMAIHPEWQRQGIGGELVTQAQAQWAEEGTGVMVVLGHEDYYPRFGFSPALAAQHLQNPFGEEAAPAFMAFDPAGVLAARGGDAQATLSYPPAFGLDGHKEETPTSPLGPTLGHEAIADAYAYAAQFHRAQVDRLGSPYIHHVLRVAAAVRDRGPLAEITAALHDVVEDTDRTLDDIRKRFGGAVAESVDAMTHRPDEDYFEGYIPRVLADPIARIVKQADARDNRARAALFKSEKDRERAASKYDRVLSMIDEAMR